MTQAWRILFAKIRAESCRASVVERNMAEGKRGTRVAPDVNGIGGGAEGLAERANQASTIGWSSHGGIVERPMAARAVLKAASWMVGAKI